MEAERLGLVTVTIDPPRKSVGKKDASGEKQEEVVDYEPFLISKLNLMLQFMPTLPVEDDMHPASRRTWDSERLACLQHCVETHLLPSLQKEFRRDLVRIGKEAIVEEAANNFSKMLTMGPYVPQTDSRERVKEMLKACPNRAFYGTVASIFLSVGRNEPLCMAYVNKDGVLRAHDYLPAQAQNQKHDRIRKFIVDNRPDLIVLNASVSMAGQNVQPSRANT